jgi:hypothetical protein
MFFCVNITGRQQIYRRSPANPTAVARRLLIEYARSAISPKKSWLGLNRVWQKILATVILIAAKNLAGITEILRCAQNDKIAKNNCHTR